jgi:hypothetical protein
MFLDKSVDYWKTTGARYACALTYNNLGLKNFLVNAREAAGVEPFSPRDLRFLHKRTLTGWKDNAKTRQTMDKRVLAKRDKQAKRRADKEHFDFGQDPYVAYKAFASSRASNDGAIPSQWVTMLGDEPARNSTLVCVSCRWFLKHSSDGLCKRCYHAVINNLKENFPQSKPGMWTRLTTPNLDLRPVTP